MVLLIKKGNLKIAFLYFHIIVFLCFYNDSKSCLLYSTDELVFILIKEIICFLYFKWLFIIVILFEIIFPIHWANNILVWIWWQAKYVCICMQAVWISRHAKKNLIFWMTLIYLFAYFWRCLFCSINENIDFLEINDGTQVIIKN